jgi:hypothetical protein
MRRIFALSLLTCLAACAPAERGGESAPEAKAPEIEAQEEPLLSMPAPYRKRLAAAVSLNASCEGCHDEEAREWRGSHHQLAHVDPAFRRAFAIEPTPFCRGCHAPEADPAREPPAAVSALGVGCVTCHVTEEGSVLAGPREGDGPENAPHPLRRTRDLGDTAGCAGCHEFRFPALFHDDDAAFMQTTAREHRRSPASREACATCHMPAREGRRSHAFAEVRDPVWLRRMLEVRAERAGEDRVRLTLTQTAPGHAFPTGDLFRRLEVGCELVSGDGAIEQRAVRHLARHFLLVPGTIGRELVGDDRVFDDPRAIECDMKPVSPADRGAVVAWWVSYQRVATVGTGLDPRDAEIESEVLLHAGVIPWDR